MIFPMWMTCPETPVVSGGADRSSRLWLLACAILSWIWRLLTQARSASKELSGHALRLRLRLVSHSCRRTRRKIALMATVSGLCTFAELQPEIPRGDRRTAYEPGRGKVQPPARVTRAASIGLSLPILDPRGRGVGVLVQSPGETIPARYVVPRRPESHGLVRISPLFSTNLWEDAKGNQPLATRTTPIPIEGTPFRLAFPTGPCRTLPHPKPRRRRSLWMLTRKVEPCCNTTAGRRR